MTNKGISNPQSKKFAERFLVANDSDIVASIIEELESNHAVKWCPLGDDLNNYATVHNQAASPMAAFAELPINSADAQMFKFFENNAPDSIDSEEYTSMKEAVKAYWVDLDEAEIEIIADGEKPKEGNSLNLTTRDNGKGKTRNEFGDFVGLSEPGLKKQEYGFCQGQYGMGSTGVLKYCGNTEEEFNERCFKFIASASVDAPEEWSWTVVRDNPHESQFEYLTIDGDFPIFDGTFGSAIADKFRNIYSNDYDFDSNTSPPPAQKFGSFVKIYDYDTTCTRTNISGYTGFRYKFERFIVDSPFPIRLTDIRYENNKVPHSETQGFLPTLRDGREHLLKGEEHIRVETNSDTLGERDAHILVFKSDDELENVETTDRGKDNFVQGTTKSKDAPSTTGIQKDHAIMLTVNGQTHGSKNQFFLERLGYSKVAEDTVVIVEFDDLANLGLVKMFRPSRDDLTDSPQTQKFIEGLKNGLKNSDLLSEEEERRRATRGSKEEHIDTETFQEFVERHPDIANFIDSGETVDASYLSPANQTASNTSGSANDERSHRIGDDGIEDTTGQEGTHGVEPPLLPTYLRPIESYDPNGDHTVWNEENRYMSVELPVNGQHKVRFVTDAQNDYLAREILSGDLNIRPSNCFCSGELRDGILTLTISPDENAEVGDVFVLTVELTRPDPTECNLYDNANEAFPNHNTGDEREVDIVLDGGLEINSLKSILKVEYIEAQEQPSYTAVNPRDDDSDSERNNAGGEIADTEETSEASHSGRKADERTLDMPDIERVYEEHWRVNENGDPINAEKYRPEIADTFNQDTIIEIEPSRDGSISGLKLIINMDAAPLRHFIIEENVKDNWKEHVERQYELAVVFYAISQYRELSEKFGESLKQSEIMTTEIVSHSINGIGQTLMPTIIPENQLEEITE